MRNPFLMTWIIEEIIFQTCTPWRHAESSTCEFPHALLLVRATMWKVRWLCSCLCIQHTVPNISYFCNSQVSWPETSCFIFMGLRFFSKMRIKGRWFCSDWDLYINVKTNISWFILGIKENAIDSVCLPYVNILCSHYFINKSSGPGNW